MKTLALRAVLLHAIIDDALQGEQAARKAALKHARRVIVKTRKTGVADFGADKDVGREGRDLKLVKVKRELSEHKLKEAQRLRAEEKRWKAQVEEHKRELFEVICIRTAAARGNDARLDAAEEETAAALREEHSKEREMRRLVEASFKQNCARAARSSARSRHTHTHMEARG